MDLPEEVRRITESMLAPGQFLIDVVVSARKGPKKIMVVLDSDLGVNIDDCAEISRQLAKVLDDRNLVSDNYLLEVTSPGIDQPLKLKRQYEKNVGRLLKVRQGDQTIDGRLIGVADDHILLEQHTGTGKKKEIKQINIPFSSIEKAFVQVSFK